MTERTHDHGMLDAARAAWDAVGRKGAHGAKGQHRHFPVRRQAHLALQAHLTVAHGQPTDAVMRAVGKGPGRITFDDMDQYHAALHQGGK